MLSICIPVYNFDLTNFVEKLINQSISNSLTIEILIFDDGSKISFKEKNRSIRKFDQVIYKELKKNMGSAAIRNKLASHAQYERILFLDCDSDIHSDFIKTYMPHITSNESIIYGGRIHPKTLPSNDKSLRWKVGKKKEDHDAKIRNKIPNKSFMSNNFLIKKKLFNYITFDETIERSGHEDTMFGIELELKGIKIIHINNPVVHIGLENNEEFINKTKQRLETLKYLTYTHCNNNLLNKRITLLRYFHIVKKIKITRLLSIIFHYSQKIIERNLRSKNPSMFLYDFYKLGYYLNIIK